MDPRAFCAQARVIIVAGKGGVGKTTVSAALAVMAARAGLATLVVEVEGKSGLPTMFGHSTPLDYHERTLAEAGSKLVESPGSEPLAAKVTARTLTPDDALVEYLEAHGLGRLSRRLASTGTLDVVATSVPGIKDILVLGKVKQLERAAASRLEGAPELIVVDAPAAGHAVTFLSSARGLVDAVGAGPIRTQAEEVIELLSDPARCQVLLVTLPEETPVNEAVETAFKLEDRAGVSLAPIVVNGVFPAIDLPADPASALRDAGLSLDEQELAALVAAAEFRRRRQELQGRQLARLREALPLPTVELPYVFSSEVGLSQLDALAGAMAGAVSALGEVPSR